MVAIGSRSVGAASAADNVIRFSSDSIVKRPNFFFAVSMRRRRGRRYFARLSQLIMTGSPRKTLPAMQGEVGLHLSRAAKDMPSPRYLGMRRLIDSRRAGAQAAFLLRCRHPKICAMGQSAAEINLTGRALP